MICEFRPFNIKSDMELVRQFLLDTQKLTGTVPDDVERDGIAYIAAVISAQERDMDSCAMLLENGRIVGFIDFQVSLKNPKNGFIRFAYVVAQERRRGHGQKLIDHALAHFKNKGCEKVYLDVAATNDSSIAFYTKYGWSFTEKKKGMFRRMCRII